MAAQARCQSVTGTPVGRLGLALGAAAPTLVIVAQPQAGALQGVAVPALGTLLMAAEMAPVAGKVVATRQASAGLVVTLALAAVRPLAPVRHRFRSAPPASAPSWAGSVAAPMRPAAG